MQIQILMSLSLLNFGMAPKSTEQQLAAWINFLLTRNCEEDFSEENAPMYREISVVIIKDGTGFKV